MRNQCKFLYMMVMFAIKIEAAAYDCCEQDMALCSAVLRCDAQRVEQLLAEGANINASGFMYERPLIYAVKDGGSLAMVDLLLENGADANACSRADFTALHYAVNSLCDSVQVLAIVKSLLKAGANVNNVTRVEKNTPLHLVGCGRIKTGYAIPIAFQMLASGVDRSAKNFCGYTAAELAHERESSALAEFIESYPGRNLQERAIFSLAKKHYNVEAEAQSDIEQSVLRMAYPGNPNHYVDLFYKIIGKERPDISRAAAY